MGEITFHVPIPLDEDGFVDRECPAPECGRVFKVLSSDCEKSTSLAMYCPFCRWEDEPPNFTTTEQQDYLQGELEAKMAEQVQEILGGFAKHVNRRNNRRSPISIKVSTKFADIPVPVPPEALKSMTLRIGCEQCGCTYAVIGAGFFCPLCGANSARHTFRQSVAKSRTAIKIARQLEGVLDDPDAVSEGSRSLLESQMGDLVTAFQRYAGATYPLLPATPSQGRDRNLFQRLDDASTKWVQAGGRAFNVILSLEEWTDIKRYFQQRHLFAHAEGIVDQEYLDKSGDSTYRIGQRLSVTESQIARMVALVEKLGLGLAADLPNVEPEPVAHHHQTSASVFPPKMPGVTDNDWLVYQLVCEAAVHEDHEHVSGQSVWELVAEGQVDEEEFEESLEILESKSLVTLYRVIDRNHIPRHVTLTQRGLEIFFSHTMANYQSERKKVAASLLQGLSSSDVVMEKTKLSKLFVHHVLRDFESRRWVGKILWTGGIAVVHLNSSVHLKRLVSD